MEQIVKFYEELMTLDSGYICEQLRSYAKENLTWEQQMKSVTEWLTERLTYDD